MRALTYGGPGRHAWTEVPRPAIDVPTSAVVRVDAVTICGTDLHILHGDLPEVVPGTVLGHEAVGTVEEIGEQVAGVSTGDRVLISCISSCGRCAGCHRGAFGLCTGGGGWQLGHLVDGTQAEHVRVPLADGGLHRLPEGVSDEDALLLADILPTAYEVGVLNGCAAPGDTVVVVGAGPIGLATVATVRLFSPASVIVVDPAPARRAAAERLGASAVSDDAAVRSALAATGDGRGADVVVEAVGVPEAFELAADLVRPGGHLANVGVHGRPVTLHLERLWAQDVTITTGLVDTRTTPRLLAMMASGQLSTEGLITHRFGLHEMLEAYDVFARPADTGALKVALFRT